MIDIKRKAPRFPIDFSFSSNRVEAKGINISQKGIGFVTEEELVPAVGIPFKTQIRGFIFSDKIYSICGVGNVVYSQKNNPNDAFYHNGLEFTNLDDKSSENLFELLKDIRYFEKSIHSDVNNKSLADFNYYPSEDIFEKSNIFYESFDNMIQKKYEVFSYYLESASKSTSIFSQRKTGVKKEMVMMGSNNYLGLTANPEVIKAAKEALDKYGCGNGSGVMVGGKISIHKRLEEELADFTGKEAAILFNSGYSANVGILSGIARPQDAIINDQLNHASVFDGCKLSGAKILVYSHNNMESLERILKRAKLNYDGRIIVTNGIFSSSGEMVQLDKIVEIAQKYDCKIMVDEAHALGVIGKNGIGAS
ncbi:MAG TPA: aminotransferase class I/II-fold pyridoxal phosphate-dependent enzyme [Spirochaetota bacterium]|nr:aminotransferase class I/II-fold pyridoxal phosphate-dependent enzyme [Spirochaetota bacterium]